MGNSFCKKKKNNLELYLKDVYEKECEFKIEKEEVEFIQTGVETLVQDLVDNILEDDSVQKQISHRIHAFLSHMENMYHEKAEAKVNFSIQSDSLLQRYVAETESQVKTVKSPIIKVGSFYDGTKNKFPDEFDFIFFIVGFRSAMINIETLDHIFSFEGFEHNIHAVFQIGFEETIDKHVKSMPLYSSSIETDEVTRELKVDTGFLELHGPAYKLQLIYSNGLGEQRHIHVDLVPAVRIIDSNSQEWFVEEVRKYVEPKTFREEILAAGSSLIVRDDFAFTEIEQHFMNNILSKKHLKVYRILKYLLNGHGDGEKFEVQFSQDPYYSSYRIKIVIIFHHEACTNSDTEYLGPCVLHVLEKMRKYKKVGEFPRFTAKGTFYSSNKFKLLPHLKFTIKTLRSMQKSLDSYWYEGDKIKSVSGQYLVHGKQS